MAGVNKSSSLFCRKVRNQVLKNNTRRNKYNPKCYEFEEINSSEYASRNDFRTFMFKTNESVIPILEFYGPKDYSWKDEAKCYFFNSASHANMQTILAIPHIWLDHIYDPTIPIYRKRLRDNCYLDLEKQTWAVSLPYLVGNRFRINHSDRYSVPKDPGSYYYIGKGYEDWCLTYLKWHPSRMITSYFWSFLLIKNIELSEFDAQDKVYAQAKAKAKAKAKAENLKFECPVRYFGNIKLKYNQNRTLSCYYYSGEETACICIDCRKDYRAILVRAEVFKNYVKLHIIGPIA